MKWAFWSLFSLAILGAFIGAGIYYIFTKSVAPNEGEFALAGLEQSVSVVMDQNAIPHIEAKTRRDAIRTLGYLHASERLWQMEVLRMAGQGRLSELFGEATLSSDIFLRTLDFVSPSKSSVAHLSEESVQLLQAYSDGVNAFMERKVTGFVPRLQPEFMIIGHKPEKWEVWHSLVILKVMALTLDHNMDKEIGRLAMAGLGFSPKEIDQIYVYNNRDNVTPMPDLRKLYGYGRYGKASKGNKANFKSGSTTSTELAVVEPAWGINQSASNSWVLSGDRTTTGKPLMANDPHLALTTPSSFYLAHVQFENNNKPFNIIGGTLPGTPLFLVGRNDFVSWGLTTTRLDSQDIFLEKLHPENPLQYQTEDGFEAFEVEEIRIKIGDEDSHTFERLTSRNGPILPENYWSLKRRLPDNMLAALRWTALDRDDTTIEGALDISISRDVADLMVKTRKLVSPMQSIVVADVKGNIGLIAAGRVPIRSKENLVKGRAPVPGWNAKYQWQGYLPHAQLPKIINPEGGALVTANSHWLPKGYPHHITYDWSEDYRQLRAEELYFEHSRKLSPEEVSAGMADARSNALITFRNIAVEEIDSGIFFNEIVLINLRNWNGQMIVDAVEPLILTAWVKHVSDLLYRDDFGEDIDLLNGGSVERVINVISKSNERNWCNKQLTPKRESCGQILAEGLQKALTELEHKYGIDIAKWRWGDAHKSLHEHRPFSTVDALSGYFTNRAEIAGGRYTLLRSKHDFSKAEPYAAVTGAAYRGLYDFSDLNKSGFVNSTGQSGNVMSRHYDDFLRKWSRVEFLPMSSDPDDYNKNRLGVIEFKP